MRDRELCDRIANEGEENLRQLEVSSIRGHNRNGDKLGARRPSQARSLTFQGVMRLSLLALQRPC